MSRMRQQGFHVLETLLAIIVILGLVAAGWWVLSKQPQNNDKDQNTNKVETQKADESFTSVSWSYNGVSWSASSTPPACPDPLEIIAPVDASQATSILYPGQFRGDDYKPHGGFRFDNSVDGRIEVKAPLDAVAVNGARYLEGDSEVQYMFSFVNSCGIMYRFDHLSSLESPLRELADTLPEARKDDSRTTSFESGPVIKAGDVLATGVGFSIAKNFFVDFGVYDLRQPNSVSKDPSWQKAHPEEGEQGGHGVCWLDLLPAADRSVLRSLPVSGPNKQSDYCK